VTGINDWAASTASERIVPFGAMHPQLTFPADEIARMASLGLRGFKMHPEHQAFEPHDPKMSAIYEAALRHKMIVFFHAGADVIHPTVHGTPESFSQVIDAWPGLTIVLAHLVDSRNGSGSQSTWQGGTYGSTPPTHWGTCPTASSWRSSVLMARIGSCSGPTGRGRILAPRSSISRVWGSATRSRRHLGGNAERLLRLG